MTNNVFQLLLIKFPSFINSNIGINIDINLSILFDNINTY